MLFPIVEYIFVLYINILVRYVYKHGFINTVTCFECSLSISVVINYHYDLRLYENLSLDFD